MVSTRATSGYLKGSYPLIPSNPPFRTSSVPKAPARPHPRYLLFEWSALWGLPESLVSSKRAVATLRSWDLHSLPFNWNNFRPCILSQSPIQNWSLAWSPQLAIFGPKLTPGFQNCLVCLGITFTTLQREWFYSDARSSSSETWCPVVVDVNQNAVLISFCKKIFFIFSFATKPGHLWPLNQQR